MLNLKKTAVAVLAFGSSAVFAGTMGPVCTPGSVTVPCASTAWEFGAQALYLQPTYSGFSYVGATHDSTFHHQTFVKDPTNWAWGFKIDAAYHFSTGNDLNVNWYHLDNNFTRDITGLSAPDFRIHHGEIDLDDGFLSGNGSSNPKWDAVNLEFGQHAHFGEWKNIRFHGGVQYAHIQQSLTGAGRIQANPDEGNLVDRDVSALSYTTFNGFGPRIGADYWYNWGNGLAMYANGASALLVGTQSFNNSVTATDLNAYSNSGSTTNVIPELEAKLGLTYTYSMAQGDVSLDIGWMWVNYWNALQTGAVYGLTKETNFAVQGPFIGAKWVGNVA